MKFKHALQLFAGVGLVLLATSHWFPLGVYSLELLGAFAHFTLLLSVVFLVVSVVLNLRVLLVLAAAATLISGVLVIPHFLSSTFTGTPNFSIGQFNLYHHNPTPNAAIETLVQADADIFAIQELNSNWKPLVDSAFAISHPYRLENHWESCCYGLGFYSRFPIVSSNKLYFGEIPYYEVTVEVESQPIQLICFHTQAPAFPNKTPGRDQQMLEVANMVSRGSNTIVFGDLNIVPWDPKFNDFLTLAGLTPIRGGFQATYPMDFKVPLIPIDHIAYSGGALQPASCEVLSIPGSDHRGLIASFRIKE